MTGLNNVAADDLTPKGYHELTPEQRAAIDDYIREMQDVVIPEIVRVQRERARRVAEIRHRVLFA